MSHIVRKRTFWHVSPMQTHIRLRGSASSLYAWRHLAFLAIEKRPVTILIRLRMCRYIFWCCSSYAFGLLRKHAYSNIQKISLPELNIFKRKKKLWYCSYFYSKDRLWVLVRTASTRRFNEYTQSMFLSVGIPMGTNCAPLVADVFLFCYERDFIKSLSWKSGWHYWGF